RMASHGRDRIVWSGLLILLVLAPLPSASISPLAQACLPFALFALLAISWTDRFQDRQWPSIAERRYRLLMICWTLAMAFAFFQVLPLPPKLIAGLSPALSDLYAWSLPAESQNSAWRTLSTSSAATVQNALLIGAYAAAFALVVRHCKTRRRMLMLTMTMILVGLGEAVFGLSQVGGQLTSPASGTFVNRNHYAAFLLMALGLSMGLILARWREDTEHTAAASGSGMRLDRWARTSPLLVMSLTLLAAVIFSFSRTGLIASFVMALLFGILGSWGSLKRFIGFLSVAIGTLAILLLTGSWRGFRIVAYRFETIEESYRLAAWKGTYDLFQSSPWAGLGLGSLVDNIPRFLPTFIKEVFDHTHNEPLEILAEGGVVYAALFGVGLV
ncbi:MAG: O-antigen ligase family protein, partial [Nitrospiraceae bacterium]